ncbi:hypothetical protein INT45_002569 [Circinella minor]|uniref:Endonuclease/exonuclease/phosphatase domain-containing protein n=1 Tax=Circinella minor TaxID=1195481 RepID=A0A8H7VIA7_9FUNG|nr:hypothetical protein INT45_002569 [Circinella minor]
MTSNNILKICSLNCNSLRKTHNSEARSSLIRYLRQQQPQLLALQETNANTNDITTSSLHERHQFFEHLQSSPIFTNTTLPYTDRRIIAGDFNYNYYSTEHHNRIPTSWRDMLNTNFIDCINDTVAQPSLPTYRHGDTYFSTLDFTFASRSLRPLTSRATIKEFRQELMQHLSKIRPKLTTQHSIQEAWEALKKELQQFMQRFGRQRADWRKQHL